MAWNFCLVILNKAIWTASWPGNEFLTPLLFCRGNLGRDKKQKYIFLGSIGLSKELLLWLWEEFQNWCISFNISWVVMNTNISLNEIVSCIFNKPYYLSQITLVLNNGINYWYLKKLTLFECVFIVGLYAFTLKSKALWRWNLIPTPFTYML